MRHDRRAGRHDHGEWAGLVDLLSLTPGFG
jgi:hypothetical protein